MLSSGYKSSVLQLTLSRSSAELLRSYIQNNLESERCCFGAYILAMEGRLLAVLGICMLVSTIVAYRPKLLQPGKLCRQLHSTAKDPSLYSSSSRRATESGLHGQHSHYPKSVYHGLASYQQTGQQYPVQAEQSYDPQL